MAKKQDEGVIIPSSLEEDLLTVLRGRKLYGLEILDSINEARQKQKMRKMGIGSLYPALKRMEEAGLIQGEWGEEVAESTRRRYYILTAEGEIAISRAQAYRRELARREQETGTPDAQTAPALFSFLG